MESNNFKNPGSGCDKYGDARLKLALFLKNSVFTIVHLDYCLENGTLLGAFRNKKFIPHDDDFDYAIFIRDIAEIQGLFENIQKLVDDSPYKVRLVDSYCLKIEVYDPSEGEYILSGPKYNGANYHHVTVDLQFHLEIPDNKYKQLYFIGCELINRKKNIFPLSTIVLENNIFPSPGNVELFLIECYGSIKQGATYNPVTCKYED